MTEQGLIVVTAVLGYLAGALAMYFLARYANGLCERRGDPPKVKDDQYPHMMVWWPIIAMALTVYGLIRLISRVGDVFHTLGRGREGSKGRKEGPYR